ncbi:hypothetical protein [Streptomyces macrosporus]|uniref:hypothetical protein n=1 Tax=Streptomyces macrosporus TaxID=44032 RepID=UPI003CD073D3
MPALTDPAGFDTSAMDGWAVSEPGPWHHGGIATGSDRGDRPASMTGVPAGHTPAPLPHGRAVTITTRARIPSGATAVLRSEHSTVGEGNPYGADPVPGAGIRRRGRERRSGTDLLGTTGRQPAVVPPGCPAEPVAAPPSSRPLAGTARRGTPADAPLRHLSAPCRTRPFPHHGRPTTVPGPQRGNGRRTRLPSGPRCPRTTASCRSCRLRSGAVRAP